MLAEKSGLPEIPQVINRFRKLERHFPATVTSTELLRVKPIIVSEDLNLNYARKKQKLYHEFQHTGSREGSVNLEKLLKLYMSVSPVKRLLVQK